MVRMVIFDGLSEVYIACNMRACVPLVKQTVEDEGGFADAAGAVEDEGLRDAVVLGVVVEDSLEEWARDYPPCLVHHLVMVMYLYSSLV